MDLMWLDVEKMSYEIFSHSPFSFSYNSTFFLLHEKRNFKKETKLQRGIISTIKGKVQQIQVIIGNATGKPIEADRPI